MVTPQGPMSGDSVTLVRYPDSLRQEMTLPMGKITSVVTPTAAFVITPMGTQDLPSSQRDEAAGELRTEVLNILKNAANPKYNFAANGNELTISADGAVVRWVVDPATGRLLRTIRTGQRGETVTEYTEWKKFGALNFATSAKMTRGGEPSGDMTVKNVEINPTVDANAFTKP
jgi:hypothetical protein